MKNKTELINILKAELTLLAQDIIKDIHKKDIKDIYKASRKLYDKTNAIHQLSKLMEIKELNELFGEKTELSQTKSTEKLINENKIENSYIGKNFKEQKKEPEELDEPLSEESQNSINKENRQASIYKSVTTMKFVPKSGEAESKVLNKEESKQMNIGLNDKIAFIRHLFNNDGTTYNKTIERLNTFQSYEDALTYINKEIKPKYNNWEGKDEYEFRLIQLLELKFN